MPEEKIITKEFFGRTEVLSLLDKRVLALKDGFRQNIAITGQRLAGKTHLLHNFLDRLKDPSVLPIYIEAIGEPFETFAVRFMGTLLYAFLKIKKEEAREDFEYLIEASRKYLPQTVKTMLEIKCHLSKRDFNKAYFDILNLTSIVKKEAGVRCVVIFDEFQNLSLLGLKEPFKYFGKVIMIQKDTMYIISSSDKSAIKRILSEELSLLFGNFEIVELKGFDFNSSKEFLDKKLITFTLNNDLKSFLITLTDGNPFYMDLLCSKLRELAIISSTNNLTTDLTVNAIEDLFFNPKGTANQYFSNLINNIGLNTATIDVLVTIAKGVHTLKGVKEALKITLTDASGRLKKLIELNIILKNGSFYFFADKGFLFWIKEVYNRKQTSLISSAIIRSEQFKSNMHSYIDKFVFELRKDFTQRVSELFTKFNDEIVEADTKKHRLPKFKKVDFIKLNKSSSLLLAYKQNKLWACFLKEGTMLEDDIRFFVGYIKQSKLMIANKILIAMDGIDINAALIAKENKIWIWNLKNLNIVMDVYNQDKIIRYR